MNFSEWSALRSSLHHDWMQKYMIFLYARQSVLDEMACGEAEWRDDVKAELFEWKLKEEYFIKLFDSCEEAISPRQYLDEPPLNAIPLDSRKWLCEVVHALYLDRTRIRDTISSLKTLLEKADAAFMDMLEGGSEEPSPAGHFIYRLKELSKAISRLPHNIQVV